MLVNLKNNAGMVKVGQLGFSWTTFFFGPLVPLFRGDFKWFIIMALTFYLCPFLWSFLYNKIYTKGLLNKGFGPAGEDSKSTLIRYGISIM